MIVVLEIVISVWVWKSRAKEFADEIGYGVWGKKAQSSIMSGTLEKRWESLLDR